MLLGLDYKNKRFKKIQIGIAITKRSMFERSKNTACEKNPIN